MMGERRAKIAVLMPGEMGSRIGRALRESGHQVLTCVEGRSERTHERAAAAGLELLPSLDEVVAVADVVISVVGAVVARPLAAAVAEALARSRRPVPLLYVNTNSIGPGDTSEIARSIVAAGARFVDGSIIGGPATIPDQAAIYLSGDGAAQVAELLGPALHCTNLGRQDLQATCFKALYAGLSHELIALGVELFAGAERMGFRDRLLEKFREVHPGAVSLWELMLPRVPTRALRQADEVTDLAKMLQDLGVSTHMAEGARATFEEFADRQGTA